MCLRTARGVPAGERGDSWRRPRTRTLPTTSQRESAIKQAARKLFALNGVDAVAVRDIVREAGGKNVSALNYYFGSKEELIETLIHDALAAANARWGAALAALEAAGGPNSVREVVEILVLRGLPPNAGEGDEASARFFATLLHTRRRLVTDTVARLEIFRLRPCAAPHPPIDAADARWRQGPASPVLLLGFVVNLRRPRGRAGRERELRRAWSAPDPLDNFIDAAVAMLEAPLTSPIEDIRKGSSAPESAKTGRRV